MGSSVSHVRIVDGVSVPSLFYGTAWKEERTRELTGMAIDAGFRAIDTANQRRHYVEEAVGDAVDQAMAFLPASGDAARALTRDQLFLQTKFTYARGQDHRIPYDRKADPSTQVTESLESSLLHLRTAYVDSYLLHGPSASQGISQEDRAVWSTMGVLQGAGKIRLLGISNVAVEQLALLLEGGGVKPAFVQNRCFARAGWDRDVRTFCGRHDIVYQAFSLLTANRRELGAPAIAAIAKKTGRTVPQVIFRFALQAGMIPLTGTSSPAHMREDLACFDFDLSEPEMTTIERG